MTNFFNAIGVADMERVHSAVMGWMLSDGCEAFGENGNNVKSNLLCKLFDSNTSHIFSKIAVNVEVFDIDILITTEDQDGKQECWVIENKIKSNQHSNQLDKYVKIIAGEKIGKDQKAKIITEKYKLILEEKRHFCFLTLIDEEPQGDFRQKWVNFTYKELSGVLEYALNNGNKKHEHWIILNEYAKCIKELNNALEDFLTNLSNYKHVFTDGNKRKADKDEQYLNAISRESGQYGRYISECGLETIFQKCYLGKKWKEHLKTIQKEYDWGIFETRGNAMLDIGYPNIKGTSEEEEYNTQIEFQNGTFKVQILPSKEYIISKEGFSQKWKKIFEDKKEELNKDLKDKKPQWRVNSSRSKNISRYISLSLQVEKWWESTNLWTSIDICENLLNELIKKGNCVIVP